jgi:hypothetical protein
MRVIRLADFAGVEGSVEKGVAPDRKTAARDATAAASNATQAAMSATGKTNKWPTLERPDMTTIMPGGDHDKNNAEHRRLGVLHNDWANAHDAAAKSETDLSERRKHERARAAHRGATGAHDVAASHHLWAQQQEAINRKAAEPIHPVLYPPPAMLTRQSETANEASREAKDRPSIESHDRAAKLHRTAQLGHGSQARSIAALQGTPGVYQHPDALDFHTKREAEHNVSAAEHEASAGQLREALYSDARKLAMSASANADGKTGEAGVVAHSEAARAHRLAGVAARDAGIAEADQEHGKLSVLHDTKAIQHAEELATAAQMKQVSAAMHDPSAPMSEAEMHKPAVTLSAAEVEAAAEPDPRPVIAIGPRGGKIVGYLHGDRSKPVYEDTEPNSIGGLGVHNYARRSKAAYDASDAARDKAGHERAAEAHHEAASGYFASAYDGQKPAHELIAAGNEHYKQAQTHEAHANRKGAGWTTPAAPVAAPVAAAAPTAQPTRREQAQAIVARNQGHIVDLNDPANGALMQELQAHYGQTPMSQVNVPGLVNGSIHRVDGLTNLHVHGTGASAEDIAHAGARAEFNVASENAATATRRLGEIMGQGRKTTTNATIAQHHRNAATAHQRAHEAGLAAGIEEPAAEGVVTGKTHREAADKHSALAADYEAAAAKENALPAQPVATPALATKPTGTRDPRLPAPGSKLVKVYHGKHVSVDVTDAGFSFEGRQYTSLSKIATELAGSAQNGFVFFGLGKK